MASGDPTYDLAANWRWLNSEWGLARQGWSDEYALEFENEFLAELESECSQVTDATARLMQVLEYASRIATER